jgi:hypothetical protein
MNNELHHIDLDSLVRMHQTATFRLQAALLNGAAWHDVHDQRELVTELSIAIQRRRSATGHPAASMSRVNPQGQSSPAKREDSP